MQVKTLLGLTKTLQWRSSTFISRWKSDLKFNSPDHNKDEDNFEKKSDQDDGFPPEPSFCCMSGCANCVWIKYAQEVAQKFDNGDVIVKKKIMEKVDDPRMRAYLFTQLGIK